MTALGKISEYKLIDYIHDMFDDWPAELIFYKTHVRPEFKDLHSHDISRDSKHRPALKKYFIDGVKVFEKYWTFTVDENNFMTTKRVEIALVKKSDNTLAEKFTISYDEFDQTNPDDLNTVMEERASSRKFVIATLKGQLMYLLQALHPEKTVEEIQNWGASFFNMHSAAISSYYEANNSKFIASVTDDSQHTWLDDVAQPGITIRTMIIGAVM